MQKYDELGLHVLQKKTDRIIECLNNLTKKKKDRILLVDYFIELYCKFYTTRQSQPLEKIVYYLSKLENITVSNKLYLELIKDLFLCLIHRKYKISVDALSDTDIQKYIHIYANSTIPIDKFHKFCTEETRYYFGLLKICMKKKDKRGIRTILDFLIQSKILVSNEIDYKYISHIKDDLRGDIVWYLWYILLDFSKSDNDRKIFIKNNLYVYAFNFKESVRNTRINILYFCFLN